MLRNRDGFGPDGRRLHFLDMGGDAPPAPDYTPVAAASEESARIGAAQADRVLAESKRQYDRNMEVAQPVIDSQLKTMDQTAKQGADYYDYLKTYRPLEEGMRDQAKTGSAADSAAERQAIIDAGMTPQGEIDALNATNRNLQSTIAAGYGANYDADRPQIQRLEGMAAADVAQQAGIAQQAGNRRMLAMGINPNSGRFASTNRMAAIDQARAGVGAINAARNAGVADFRGRTAAAADVGNQNFAQNQAIRAGKANNLSLARGMRVQDDSTAWAKKLDAAGLVRGLPGASTGAYGAATAAGNSAVANSTAVGNGMVAGTGAAAGLVMQGQGAKLQGLSNVLNSQQSTYNSQMQANSANSAGMGSLLGMGMKLGMNYFAPGSGLAMGGV